MSVVDSSPSSSSTQTALQTTVQVEVLPTTVDGPKGSATVVSRPGHTIPWTTVRPQRLASLQPPPCRLADYPRVSSRRRHPQFDAQGRFSVSTHIFPAAYPRNKSSGTWQWNPPPPETKDKRKYVAREVSLMASRKEAMESRQFIPGNRDEVLYMVANRYVPRHRKHQSDGVTLVLVHGAGVHKEVCSIHRLARSL